MPRTKKTNSVEVDALRHTGESRANIPTSELRDFIGDEEMTPPTLRYARDPSLDPQLVWKGKDEQDGADLAVPAVPIYIQEKIQPQAIVEEVRRSLSPGTSPIGRGEKAEEQLSLFGDFNGIDFDQLIEFYQHQQHWTNRMILGDSLLVMTSLAEKEGLKGQVQMIYLDPPYGIKFGSNWQVSTRKRDVKDGRAEDATRQPEQVKAFRDTWELGIHSYLAYLRDRLVVARELLTDSGSLFLQIGEENVHLVRDILDEVFGSQNFVSQITYSKTTGATVVLLPGVSDYIIWYAKDTDRIKYRQLYSLKSVGGEGSAKYDQVQVADGNRGPLSRFDHGGLINIPEGGRVFRLDNLMSQSMGREKGEGAASWFEVSIQGHKFTPNMRSRWKTNQDGMTKLIAAGRVEITTNTLAYVRFIEDFPAYPLTNAWLDIGGIQSRTDPKIYVAQTANTAVERCLLMTTDPGDLVLDPTCGSGTTAYVAEQWGRRWITVDTSRVAIALARTRLMAGRYPYYLLADTPEGARKERELTGSLGAGEPGGGGEIEKDSGPDIRRGFVYKRVPHVTLKSIANNDEIDAIHAEWQAQLEPARAELNKRLKETWEEWEIPREPDPKWPEKARELHALWWGLRRERQTAIDASKIGRASCR